MELYHKEKFNDVFVKIVPNTRIRRSRTEENNILVEWMKETGRIPLSYLREISGIHVELSNLFEARIKDALNRGYAIGADGRKYIFVEPNNLFPIGSDICVRAKAEGDKYSDAYSLDFFV